MADAEEPGGLKLFRKLGNKYLLTYAGERYIERAGQILQIKKDLDLELADIIKRDVGVLKVAFPTMRCTYMLPSILPPFQQLYPNVKVQIREGHSQDLDEHILRGEAEIAFYTQPAGNPNPALDYENLYSQALNAVWPGFSPPELRQFPLKSVSLGPKERASADLTVDVKPGFPREISSSGGCARRRVQRATAAKRRHLASRAKSLAQPAFPVYEYRFLTRAGGMQKAACEDCRTRNLAAGRARGLVPHIMNPLRDCKTFKAKRLPLFETSSKSGSFPMNVNPDFNSNICSERP